MGVTAVAAALAMAAMLPPLGAAPVKPRAVAAQPRAVSFQDRLQPRAGPVPVAWSPSYGASVVLALPAQAPDPHVSVLRVRLR